MSFTPNELSAIRAQELVALNASGVCQDNEQPRANSDSYNFIRLEDVGVSNATRVCMNDEQHPLPLQLSSR